MTIGRIISEVNIGVPILSDDFGGDLYFLTKGDISAGGLGGTLMLVYPNHQREYHLDFRLWHTFLKLPSTDDSADLRSSADAITTTAWVSASVPVKRLKIFGNLSRSVWKVRVTSFSGDQGNVIGIDWLAKVGMGIELETENTRQPLPKRARVVASYVFSDDYSGYSFGIGVNF